MQASLIIATYNQGKNLALILESVRLQSCQDFEIIIADDGSSDKTSTVIETFRQNTKNLTLTFITQEDRGFRKTVVLNKAIQESRSDYLIFIDGDMLLDKKFIENHLRYRHDNAFLCGHRGVKLSPGYSEKIVTNGKLPHLNLLNMVTQKALANVENPLRCLKIERPWLRQLAIPFRDNLSGCNFSVYKDALYAINGFNEDILEHGYNDYELGHRLKLAGYRQIDVSKLCNTYHIYHQTRKTNRDAVSKKIAQVDQSKNFFCSNGLLKENNSTAAIQLDAIKYSIK